MPRKLVYQWALALTLCCPLLAIAQTAERPKDFGKQWVRSHPFTLMGLCQVEKTFDIKEYQDAGMNALLAWKARPGLLGPATEAGLPHFLHLYAKEGPNEEFTKRVADLAAKYPSCLGVIVNDEPSLKLMPATREVVAWLKKNYPDRLAMSNAFPIGGTVGDYAGEKEKEGYGYSEYLADYVKIVDSDVLMFDIYPFSDAKEGDTGVSDVYYLNLKVIRDNALKANVPYWAFLQSYQTGNRRHVSESDLRMQVFSSLTYGFTGFAYFTYDVAFDRGLLDPSGDPNDLYHHAKNLNQEILNLGKSLRFLTSTDVKFVQGTKNTHVPPALSPLAPGDHKPLQNVAIVNGQDVNSGLVGFFRDDQNKQYLMVTNLHQAAGRSADQCKATFRLTFADNVKQVHRLNRKSGEVETLKISDPKKGLTLELEGGSGDLIKFDDATFPGLAK